MAEPSTNNTPENKPDEQAAAGETSAANPTTPEPNPASPTSEAEAAHTETSDTTTADATQSTETPDAVPVDTAQPAAEPATETPAPAAPTKPPGKPNAKLLILIIGAVIFVGIIGLLGAFLSAGNKTQSNVTNVTENETPNQTTTDAQKEKTLSDPKAYDNLLVYGTWNGQRSILKGVDLTTQKTKQIASLPDASKKVFFLSPTSIIFMDQIDRYDHGRQIMIYDLKKKLPQLSIPTSASEFGVRDYVLSPDKKYIAIWEVSLKPPDMSLLGGKSRVFAVDLRRPTVKKLLYDEKIGPDPVHYPRAILNDGRIFMDKLLPSSSPDDPGWAYGVSIVDATGINKEELPYIKSGTYGTQPHLSPDGNYLIFSGYDGNRGEGLTIVNGVRQAILSPNTVEIFDIKTLTRKRFAAFEPINMYPSSVWDPISGKILLTVGSADPESAGFFTYDMTTQELKKILLPSIAMGAYSFIAQLTDDTALIGIQDKTAPNINNLSDTYPYPYTQVATFDMDSSDVNILKLEDRFVQFVTVLPKNFLK